MVFGGEGGGVYQNIPRTPPPFTPCGTRTRPQRGPPSRQLLGTPHPTDPPHPSAGTKRRLPPDADRDCD